MFDSAAFGESNGLQGGGAEARLGFNRIAITTTINRIAIITTINIIAIITPQVKGPD